MILKFMVYTSHVAVVDITEHKIVATISSNRRIEYIETITPHYKNMIRSYAKTKNPKIAANIDISVFTTKV